jgi:DNA-binding NtrC family response regulator
MAERAELAMKDAAILIVEDEMIVGMALEDVFAKAGAQRIDIAPSLAAADILLAEKSFDAAIVDLRLPDGESLDLSKALVGQGVPVVIYSGHADAEYCGQVPQAQFCTKPSTPDEILKSVALAQSNLEPSQRRAVS